MLCERSIFILSFLWSNHTSCKNTVLTDQTILIRTSAKINERINIVLVTNVTWWNKQEGGTFSSHGDHSSSTYVNFSKNYQYVPPDTHELLGFWKILRTDYMNDPMREDLDQTEFGIPIISPIGRYHDKCITDFG